MTSPSVRDGHRVSDWPAALNPRTSLRTRFTLLVGGSGIALGLLAMSLVDRYQRQQLVALQGQAMAREAQLLSRTLESTLQQRLQQLRDTAGNPALASGLMEPGDARALLEGIRTQQPALAWLGVLGEDGQVQVATNALLEGDSQRTARWFIEGQKAPWIGTRHAADELSQHLGLQGGQAPHVVDLAVPIHDLQGRRSGVLAAKLRWDWLEAMHRSLDAAEPQERNTESLVLDRDGRVMLGPARWLDKVPAIDALAALRIGGDPAVVDWPGDGPHVTAWGRAPEGQRRDGAALAVLVRQPAVQAFAAADGLRLRLWWLGIAATLAFMAISFWLAGRIARPIQALSRAAMRVANNEAPSLPALPPRRADEVAELANALQALHRELSMRLLAQQRATDRYEALFRDAPVAIGVVQDDRLLLANDACRRLFGAPDMAALRGVRLSALCHPDDLPRLHEHLRQTLSWPPSDPQRAPLPHRIVRLDGAQAEVETTAIRRVEREAGGAQASDAAGALDGDAPLDAPRAAPHHVASDAEGVLVVLHDVTAQRRVQAQLQQREAQLAHTSQMAQVGGWTFDMVSGRGTWTDEMARLYELPPETEPTPELALSYFQGEHRARLKAALRALVVDGDPYDLEMPLHPPSGAARWVRVHARAIRHDGRTVGLEGMTQDITERRDAQEAVQQLNEALEQRVIERTAELRAANAELDAFAYAVSHDLRAPLRAMSGFSHALIEDHGPQLDAEAHALLDHIIQGSHRMGELIEGLLALSRSVRGPLRHHDVDLSALAELALQELRRAEPSRQVRCRIEPGLQVQGDRRMLSAVIGNLIGNAWKYTQHREDAEISLTARDIDGDRWYCVTDNGAGFDMAHDGRLFKAFARLHRQDEFPGLGIGLATVHRIIQRHGGRIEAQGQPGQGATFRFTLPAQRARSPTEGSTA